MKNHPDYTRILEVFPDIDETLIRYKRPKRDLFDVPNLTYDNGKIVFNLSRFVNRIEFNDKGCKQTFTGPIHPSKFPLVGCNINGKPRMNNGRRLMTQVNMNDMLVGIEVVSTCHNARCLDHSHIGLLDDYQSGRPLDWKTSEKGI
jgi:hypothetical protein